MKRLMSAVVVFCLLLSAGCASGGGKGADSAKGRMPYVVRIVGAEATGALPEIPEEYENTRTLLTPGLLAAYLAASLDESGMFTKVISETPETKPAAGAAGSSAPTSGGAVDPSSSGEDLTLKIQFACDTFSVEAETPFGTGTNRFWPCTLSTGLWLFLGPVCWVIADREYTPEPEQDDAAVGDSDSPRTASRKAPVFLYNFVKAPGIADRRALNRMAWQVPLSPESLSYLERHNWLFAWIWNIILPPWAGPLVFGTNPKITNESLADRVLGQIAGKFQDELEARIGSDYPLRGQTYFLLGEDGKTGYVASGAAIGQIELNQQKVQELDRVLPSPGVAGSQFDSIREQMRSEIERRTPGGTRQGSWLDGNFYLYRIALPQGTTLVRLRVFEVTPDGTNLIGSWTTRS